MLEVVKEIVIGLNPTEGLVKCLINNPDVTKKHGVRNPNITATHLGTIYTISPPVNFSSFGLKLIQIALKITKTMPTR